MRPLRSSTQILAGCVLLLTTFVSEIASEKDNIVKLTKFNFDNNVERGAWFVKFYAPWCTHCQRLAPIWEKLADEAAAKEWPVKIAEVDCTSSKEVCERVQVKAFPMLLLINDGTLKDKYQGEASVAGFESWLNEQLSMSRRKASSGGHAAKGKDIRKTKGTQEASATTSPLAAIQALASYKLARFPTNSKILNIYIYGAVVLAFLVGLLYAVFQFVEAEESVEREHQE
mmetsp:Transcript_116009/g.205384  ORF Transcript_116009/g.205384 Transcript_116009/m.205384 type:complete len:229 (+) Transcript_116009:47-733(+)